MSDVDATVIGLLRLSAAGRRLRLGVLSRGNIGLVAALAAEGHRTMVIGDRFRKLFAVHRRLEDIGLRHVLVVEASLDALPVALRGLHALVLANGLPGGAAPAQTLARLRLLLAPGGLLIWPHPVIDGVRGRLGKAMAPARLGTAPPAARHRLCAWAMAAGYRAISQRATSRGPLPWVVTTGTAGRLSW
jgi:hypothetical protein